MGLLLLLVGWTFSKSAYAQTTPVQKTFDARIDQVLPAQAGIDFRHTDGGSGKRYIMESVTGSLALFDYDGDGWTDIYFVNGARLDVLDGTSTKGSSREAPPSNRLYRNLGNWTFADVTDQAGVGDVNYGMGVVVGDYDQDGDPDMLLSNYGPNVFYVNNGDGTFSDATASSGLRGADRFGAGNAFFDMDHDGDLDLYCASYVEFKFSDYKVRTIAGHLFHTGPDDYPAAADLLYRNEGDGSFTDVSSTAGVALVRAPGMGVLAADFDADGDEDLFVANDQRANFLWTNDGTGVFEEQGLLAGVAFDRQGRANGNMGAEYADLDGDGQLDLLTTTYQDEMPVYYHGLGLGLFQDETNLARLDSALTAHVNWGIGAVDFDNDRDRDLFIACGHFLDNIRFIDDRTDVCVRDYLLANDGAGKLSNATSSAGSFFDSIESSRGAAFDDLDNDGDVDVVVTNFNSSPSLGRTVPNVTHRGLAMQLVGTTSNRDAVGSHVAVIDSAGRSQTQVACGGKGYESYYGRRLYVGLGAQVTSPSETIEIRVTWPTGKIESFEFDERKMLEPNAPAVVIVEGCGK